MKQKRKIEEIPDCYHQSMGWGNLHYPLVENIAERADILSTGRLARGMIGMRHAIRGAHKVPFGLPSLLHCDPETWPDDRDNTGIHALLMPLDKPTVPAFIHTKEELDGHGPMHWGHMQPRVSLTPLSLKMKKQKWLQFSLKSREMLSWKMMKQMWLKSTEIMAPPSINFNQFLEKEKLKGNGSNFTDFRHVRIFLTGVSMQYVLEAPLGPPPPPAVSEDIKNVYETRVTRYSEIQCAILCSLEAELQKRFEHHDPCEMMRELKLIFETHAAVESYEASKQFFNCMMEEGSSVSEHMFAMSGHAKKLSDLGIVIPNKLEIKKENQVLMVNKTTGFKKQGKPNKGNFKKGGKKVAAPPEKPKAGPKPETVCYYCQGKGRI
ncbi:hypothetical protein QYE76_059301 [Lolium multiflorum]|uniref:Uncharacterized protein n=1 Tax=Lolium multiflorum TaxID=4521 RepID=A0AAD8UWJ4_LOLMU|nr:hypothetical protein QYE76_059301 [Lolium multiflorum]